MGQQANFNGGVNGDPSTTETWAAYGNLVAWAYYNADIGETFALQVARGMMSDVGLL